ncbi:MAG: DUF2188 domain-containing protein [Proteobacteria bacterium]|nr:DUF2188 domain-containing protein [Pseudomonadota bacterium]
MMTLGAKRSKRLNPVAEKAAGARHCVVPVQGGWAIKNGSSQNSARTYSSKQAALNAAKAWVCKRGGGEFWIQGRDGRISESLSFSREGFKKISAVEGIYLSSEMEKDFKSFDVKNFSDAERRREIIKKHGNKHS